MFIFLIINVWLWNNCVVVQDDRKMGWIRVAGVGWLSASAKYSLRTFVERVFAHFRDKNIVFYDCVNIGSFWLSLKALRQQDGFRWKLYKSKMAFIENSTKAGWLSLKAQWNIYEFGVVWWQIWWQIHWQICHQIWWSPNKVTNLSPNLVGCTSCCSLAAGQGMDREWGNG